VATSVSDLSKKVSRLVSPKGEVVGVVLPAEDWNKLVKFLESMESLWEDAQKLYEGAEEASNG